MLLFTILLSFAFLAFGQSAISSTCAILGQVFPPPKNISTNAIWSDVVRNITATLDAYQDNNATSFTVQIIGKENEKPLFEYYHKAPGHLYGNSTSLPIDENAIFRIGSVSKMFTTYALLVQSGFSNFEDPITKYVPELKQNQSKSFNDASWDEITIGQLVSHLSGLDRDYVLADLALFPDTADAVPSVFPPISNSSIPTCGGTIGQQGCNRQETLRYILERPRVTNSWTTPIYSNLAFTLVGYALESITGKNYSQIMQDNLFTPLNLTQSTALLPPIEQGVTIPGDGSYQTDGGDENPAGGLSFSTRDMGRTMYSVLNHKQLTPLITRRWMKPVTHTADLYNSVGAPWEIRRVRGLSDFHTVDLYGKNGGIGGYGAQWTLIPDLEVGIVILAATETFVTVPTLEYAIEDAMLPALYSIASSQAQSKYGGTYTLDGKNDTANRAFFSIQSDNGPGLVVANMTVNGTDVLGLISSQRGLNDTARLYPVQKEQKNQDGTTLVAFRLGLQSSFGCMSWEIIDSLKYGLQPLDEFVFKVGSNGEIQSLYQPGLRLNLIKVSSN